MRRPAGGGDLEDVDPGAPHGSERPAGLSVVGGTVVFAGRYHLRAYAKTEGGGAGVKKRKRVGWARASACCPPSC